METIILILAFVIEVTLAIYSLITRKSTWKARSVIYISVFVFCSILSLLSTFQWSFRWYGLAILLFIRAVLGLIDLFRNKKEHKFHISRVAGKTFSSLLLMLMAITPALLFPEYELPTPTGNYEVASVQYTYVDNSRIEEYTDRGEHRKVNVEFWYPENINSVYPLVIFSHGGLGEKRSNVSLLTELASHGYIVCSIDHPYQSLWTKDENGHVTFLSMDYFGEITREDARIDKGQSYEYYRKWMNIRTDDINFVLDTILKNAAGDPGDVYSLVDIEKIGVMGHSLGGSAALAIPRQRGDIDAVVALESPFLYDIVGVEDDEFIFVDQPYPIPILNIYSDGTWEHLSEWAQYARNYALLSEPDENGFNLHVCGAGHFSLTDLSLVSPFLVQVLEGGKPDRDSVQYLDAINKTSLEFFDRYLKNRFEFADSGFHRTNLFCKDDLSSD